MTGELAPWSGPPGALLLTGATGFLGMEVLARYLGRTDRRVYATVRAEGEEQARARIESVLASTFGPGHPHSERVVALPADVETPGLGLDAQSLDAVVDEVTDVVHCAAAVAFDLPLERARAINVLGTERVLDVAEAVAARGGLRSFSHISTTYVSGTFEGTFDEDALDVGQEFRNSYERSKFEAEQLVRDRADRLRVQIFRPSIIVGERDSGWTATFNVMYFPIRIFAKGAAPSIIPARRSTPLDIVPIDYVADAIFELSERPEGGTYHIVAGDRSTTMGQVLETIAGHFDRPTPRALPLNFYLRVIWPLTKPFYRGRRRRMLERTAEFLPYFSMRIEFDDRRARPRLEAAGLSVTPLASYFHRLLEYATAADWGRSPLGRAEARERVAGPAESLVSAPQRA